MTHIHHIFYGWDWEELAEKWGLYISDMVLMPKKSSDKIQYLSAYEYFVDDRCKTALELALRGVIVFIPDRSYNKGCETSMSNIWRLTGGVGDLIPWVQWELENTNGIT